MWADIGRNTFKQGFVLLSSGFRIWAPDQIFAEAPETFAEADSTLKAYFLFNFGIVDAELRAEAERLAELERLAPCPNN